MSFARRLLILLAVLAVVGLPAGVVRGLCLGHTCADDTGTQARVPFCPLPGWLKSAIAAGYRQGRSPDVLAVTERPDLRGFAGGPGPADRATPWTSVAGGAQERVPIVFAGTGVGEGTSVPYGTGLDDIAPTIAESIRLDRAHPDVRSGTAIPGVASGPPPRLVLEVAWKGVGSSDLQADQHSWPFLHSLMRSGAGTLDASTGSVPVDPTAILTTIGTGGLPSQHGITGTFVRNDRGSLVRAWGHGSPLPIIATLGDDLDHTRRWGQAPLIGMVGTDAGDRGIIGGTWWPGHDTDPVVLASGRSQAAAAARMLARGFGADRIPDVLAVVMRDSARGMDESLRSIVEEATRASHGSLEIIVTATGSDRPGPNPGAVTPSDLVTSVERQVPALDPVVEAAAPGGLFLDQSTLAKERISQQTIVQSLLGDKTVDGTRLMRDAFPAFAVSFGKYC